ncbi:hypothetical protein PVAG01_08520 [Phlyctema vagabunda]|uniref:Uncharacterized protein n=1 Tax=Phlyctema vagabunda TaxID=108571 RepID=A0ABR4PAA5_9HELO
MSHVSRPPLSSRIRASFEGKSRDLKSPTAGYFAQQDPETLRTAIEEAISSDAFQAAIASHLAKLINPGIKSALDTIQPVVEAVYSHEILLRKTNASVEDLLTRIDTNVDDGRGRRISVIRPGTSGTDNELEQQHGPLSSHPPNEKKKEEIERAFDVPAEKPNSDRPESVPKDAAGIDLEEMRRLLDQRDSEIISKLSTLSSSVDTNTSKIVEVVDGIADMNAALAPTLQTLPSMRSFSEQSTTVISVMQAQLDQVQTDMDAILQAVPADLGAQVKTINDHVSRQDLSILARHTLKLDLISEEIAGIKEVGASNDDPALMETLQTVSSTLESLKENIETATAASNDNFNTLGSQVTNVISTIEAQTESLDELKDSQASHGTVLGEIREKSVAASDSAPVFVEPDLSELKAKTKEILTAVQASNDLHSAHTSALESIAASVRDEKGVGPDVSGSTTALQATAAEILVAVQKSNNSHIAHSEALEELKSLNGGSTPVPTSDNAETTAALQAFSTGLASLKENIEAGLTSNQESLASLGTHVDDVLTTLEAHRAADQNADIHAGVKEINSAHTALKVALDEIKSLISVDKTDAVSVSDGSHLGHLESKIDNVIAILEAHRAADQSSVILAEVKDTNKAHASYKPAFEYIHSLKAADATQAASSGNIVKLESGLDDVLTKLEGHGTADQSAEILATLKTQTETIQELRSESFNNSLEQKLDDILATLESHHAANENSDILAGIKSHAIALEGLKLARSADNEPVISSSNLVSLEAKIDTVLNALEAHRAADQSGEILASVQSHATALESFKPITAPVVNNESAFESKLDTVLTILESYRTADKGDEILSGVRQANEAHALHASALESIKTTIANSGSDTVSSVPNDVAENIITTLASHTTALDEIKANNQRGPAEDLSAKQEAEASEVQTILDVLSLHKTTLDVVLNTLGSHTDLLTEIKEDIAAEILTGIQAINEAHAAHAAKLSEIRESDVSDEVLTALHSSNGSHASHTTAIAAVFATLDKNQASILEELKSRSTEPISTAPDTALQTQISTIASTLEGHEATLSSIRDAADASNVSHAAHLASLAEIKDASLAFNEFHASHLTSLAEIKSMQSVNAAVPSDAESSNLDSLNTHVNNLITTLEKQGATLDEIKSATENPEILTTIQDAHDLLMAQQDLLASHTTLLGAIKNENSHNDVLENISSLKSMVEESRADIDTQAGLVKDLHEETRSSHSNLTTTISALAVGGAKSAEVNTAEILSEIRTIVSRSLDAISVIVSQMDSHNTSLTHLSDDVKDHTDTSNKVLGSSIQALGDEVASVRTIVETIDYQVSSLGDGVHFNEKGVSHLAESGKHITSLDPRTSSRIETAKKDIQVSEESIDPVTLPQKDELEVPLEGFQEDSPKEETKALSINGSGSQEDDDIPELPVDESIVEVIEGATGERGVPAAEENVTGAIEANHPAIKEGEEKTAPISQATSAQAEPNPAPSVVTDDIAYDDHSDTEARIITEDDSNAVENVKDTDSNQDIEDALEPVQLPSPVSEKSIDEHNQQPLQDIPNYIETTPESPEAQNYPESEAASPEANEDTSKPAAPELALDLTHSEIRDDTDSHHAIQSRELEDASPKQSGDHAVADEVSPDLDEKHAVGMTTPQDLADDQEQSQAPPQQDPKHDEIIDEVEEELEPETPVERKFTPAEPFSHSEEEITPARESGDAPAATSSAIEENTVASPREDDDGDEESATPSASASTSAFASPTSPSFPSSAAKKGKKGKKEKKEKKEKKGKKEKFIFDPDAEDEEGDGAAAAAA